MIPNTMLIRSDKSRYPNLVPDSREKHSVCMYDSSCRLFEDALYQVEEVLFYFQFADGFYLEVVLKSVKCLFLHLLS